MLFFVIPSGTRYLNHTHNTYSINYMIDYSYFVYILTNPASTVLYTGVTNDLQQRIIEHYINRGKQETFAGRYYCYNLLYYEVYQYVEEAIDREKQIKGWRRSKKLDLIKTDNPDFLFLNNEIMDWPPQPKDLVIRDNI